MSSTIRVIFANMALGMGVDIPCIREIIHVGPPASIQQYFQETGRAGRDGLLSKAVLYYNNRDFGKNRHVGADMRAYCQTTVNRLRWFRRAGKLESKIAAGSIYVEVQRKQIPRAKERGHTLQRFI
jgi:superfamily II DNA helicase RecQ